VLFGTNGIELLLFSKKKQELTCDDLLVARKKRFREERRVLVDFTIKRMSWQMVLRAY